MRNTFLKEEIFRDIAWYETAWLDILFCASNIWVTYISIKMKRDVVVTFASKITFASKMSPRVKVRAKEVKSSLIQF